MSFLDRWRLIFNPAYARWFDAAHPEGIIVVAFPTLGPGSGEAFCNFLLGKVVTLLQDRGPGEDPAYSGRLYFGYTPHELPPDQLHPVPVRVRTRVSQSSPGVWTLSAATFETNLGGATNGQMAVTVEVSDPRGPSIQNPNAPRTATLTVRGKRDILPNKAGFDAGTEEVKFDGTLLYTATTLAGRLRDERTATDLMVTGFDRQVIGYVGP